MSFTENDGPPTRTRLPESRATGPAGGGTGRRSPRSMVTVAAVVVLLVAAIAFANRGSGGGGTNNSPAGGGRAGQADPTAPTGVEPVTGKNAGIASGFARTEQGAQSAAANYAVALVSAEILKPEQRHGIIDRLFTASAAKDLQGKLDSAYSEKFLKDLGLDEAGEAPEDMTYVSRTVPVGTKTKSYSKDSATLDVWCTGLFGMAGVSSTKPVVNDWFTMTLELRWTAQDWKVEKFSQTDGPAPVSSDRTASSADAIAEAVEQYGGFTYAR